MLEIDHIAEPDEMADVTHYYAGLLKKIAEQIDIWIVDQVGRGVAAAA